MKYLRSLAHLVRDLFPALAVAALLVVGVLLSGCATTAATWRAADFDLECTCKLVKGAGVDIPILTCKTDCPACSAATVPKATP